MVEVLELRENGFVYIGRWASVARTVGGSQLQWLHQRCSGAAAPVSLNCCSWWWGLQQCLRCVAAYASAASRRGLKHSYAVYAHMAATHSS
jgi:hypothetical protein